MADLAKLVVALEANQSKLIRGLDDTNKRIRAFQQRTDSSLKKVDKAFAGASRGVNILKGALAAVGAGAAIRGIINIADSYAQIEGRLGLVTKSSEQLSEVQSELFAIAQRTRKEYQATANLYVSLGQAADELGASQQQLLKFTEGVGNALTVASSSAQSASGALLQLGQLIGGVVVQAQEFNSLIDGARPILVAVANGVERFGGSVIKLREEVKKGTFTSREFFDGFLVGSQDLAKQAESLQRTVSQSVVQLRNEFEKTISEIDLSALVDGFDDLKDTVSDPKVSAGLQAIAAGLVLIAAAAAKVLSVIGNVATDIGTFIGESLAKLTGAFSTDIKELEADVTRLRTSIELGFDPFGIQSRRLAKLEPVLKLFKDLEQGANNARTAVAGIGNETENIKPIGVDESVKQTEILSQNIADIEASSARITATLNAEQAELERNYAQNLVSFAQFFDRRAEIQQAAIDQEIKARQASLALAQAQEQEKIKAGKSAESIIRTQGKIIGEISALEIQRGEIAKQAAYESAQANRELVESLESVAIQIQRIQGDTVGAALADFDSSNRKLIERLFVEGNRAGIEQVKTLRSLVESQERFNRLQQEALDIKEDLAIFEERIRNSQEVGAKTEFEALREIGQARERSLDQLQSIYESQRRIAEEAGNPELIRNVKRFSAELDTLATQTDLVGQKFRGIFKDSFTDFFESLADGTKGFHEVFTDLLNDIHRQITRLAAQNLAEQLFGASGGGGGGSGLFGKIIGGVLGSFGGGGSTAVASDLGHVQGFASGGRYSANEPRIVGEFGPELDIPDHSGRIIPNNELGGGMSVTIQQSITVADGGTLSPRSRHQIANETAIGVQRALARHNGR